MLHFLHKYPLSLNCVDEELRERMERLVVLPFSGGCVSHSSVAVFEHQPRRAKSEPNSTATKKEDELVTGFNMKDPLRFFTLPKPNISTGFQRIFKSFSKLFVYKEELDMEEEIEMEIGCPTDVKHLTHIGYDGTTTTINPKTEEWDNHSLIPPHLLASLPFASSLEQFELAMAAQAHSPFLT